MESDLAMQDLASQEIGIMLSNTSIIYPKVRDNFGKLRIIPDIGLYLE